MSDELNLYRPEVRILIESYLDGVEESCGRDVRAKERSEIREGLVEYISENLDPAASDEEVAAFLARLGGPEGSDGAARKPASRGVSGTVLGVPYGAVPPGEDENAARWWDPRSSRIFVPRMLGIGWDINYGALAVKLHLIDPDSEDEPFHEVPDWVHLVGLAIPVVLTVLLVVFVSVFAPRLPEQLPLHWDIRGHVDRWGGFWEAFGLPLFLSIGSTGYAAYALLGHRRSPLGRAVSVAFALFFSVLGFGITLSILLTVSPVQPPYSALVPPTIVLTLLAPLVYLVVLSRIGERRERNRMLRDSERKEG